MPTIFEQTIEALNFDPYGDGSFDLRLPETLYPTSVTSFIDYLGGEVGPHVDTERGGEPVRSVDADGAAMVQGGDADGD